MKLLMVYPNPSQHSPSFFTPLSILFAGASYESQGYDVEYFDMRFDNNPQKFSRAIKESDAIGVSSMSGSQLVNAIEIMKYSKQLNPNIKVILGGPHAKMLPDQCLKEHFVDEVVTEDLGLDTFPFNDRTKKFFKDPYIPIWFTSTGCPHNCGFCGLEKQWKPKDIDIVLTELSILHDKLKFKSIDLIDPNIGKREDRLTKLGEWMRERDVTFHTNIRNDYLDANTCDILDKAKCRSLELGCESGSNRILKDIIKKGHDVETTKKAIKNLAKTSISPMCSFMVGVPTEQKEDVIKSMDLVDWIMKTNKKARCSFYSYVPYPGTSMMELAKKHQGFKEPKNMHEWSNIQTMSKHPLYWIAGLCFRKENTAKNFPGSTREIIAPYERLAEKAWEERHWENFPSEKVEKIINGRSC